MTKRSPFTPYPYGWFMVARSDEVRPGAALPIRYFGRDLVLFRTEAGTARMFDAYCPHLGAHLGHGGRVRGEVLECPFHGWCFDEKGACVEVPYAKKIPAKASVRSWPLEERNGVLMAYYHEDASVVPNEGVPQIAELASSAWTTPVPHKFRMRTHVQEIAENVIDLAHTRFLHGMEEELQVVAFQPDNETLRFQLVGRSTTLDAELHGLGVQFYRFRTDLGEGPVEFVNLIMPAAVDDEYIDWQVMHTVKRTDDDEETRRTDETVSRFLDSGAQADLEIFQHKTYRSTPLLSDADGPIVPLRRWAQQFYE